MAISEDKKVYKKGEMYLNKYIMFCITNYKKVAVFVFQNLTISERWIFIAYLKSREKIRIDV